MQVKLQASLIPMSAVPQILRPNDAQGIALGLTGVSYREGLFSTYTNPAGLKFEEAEFAFSHIPESNYYGDMKLNQEAFALGFPLKSGYMLALHYFFLNYGEYNTYDYISDKHKKIRAGYSEFQLSASKIFISHKNQLSFGINVKYVKYTFPPIDARTLLIDIGMRCRFNLKKTWNSFGISVSNLGKELEDDGYKLQEPVKLLRIGITNGTDAADLSYLYTIEYQRSLNKKKTHILWNHLGIGVELRILKTMFCRLGYSFDFADIDNDDKAKGLTYGMGFKTPKKIKILVPLNISLNYGKGIAKYVHLNSNVVSVMVGFEM
jgi:hypothetical protein